MGSTLLGDILPVDETPKEACSSGWSAFLGENMLVLIGESMLCCCCSWLKMADLCEGEKAAEAIAWVLVQPERLKEAEPGRGCEKQAMSLRTSCCWASKSRSMFKSSGGISRTLREDLRRLD
nr:hypothetical protein Iba_scaffold49759CG0010 [Ipomoea batatas]